MLKMMPSAETGFQNPSSMGCNECSPHAILQFRISLMHRFLSPKTKCLSYFYYFLRNIARQRKIKETGLRKILLCFSILLSQV